MNSYEFQIPLPPQNLAYCPGYLVVPDEIREIWPSRIAGCECNRKDTRIAQLYSKVVQTCRCHQDPSISSRNHENKALQLNHIGRTRRTTKEKNC